MPFEMDLECYEEARAAHSQDGRSYPDLDAYIARHYVDPKRVQNQFVGMASAAPRSASGSGFLSFFRDSEKKVARKGATHPKTDMAPMRREDALTYASEASEAKACEEVTADFDFEKHESALNERMTH